MTRWFGNHQQTNKDPDKDMVNNMRIHSTNTGIILKTKVENNVFLNTLWATLFENCNTFEHIWCRCVLMVFGIYENVFTESNILGSLSHRKNIN